MSKMSNEHVRDAESRSLDNAAEVDRLVARGSQLIGELREGDVWLRSEVDRLAADEVGRLRAEFGDLAAENGHLQARIERLEGIINRARTAIPSGQEIGALKSIRIGLEAESVDLIVMGVDALRAARNILDEVES